MRKPALALILGSLVGAAPHLSTFAVENSGHSAENPSKALLLPLSEFSLESAPTENGEHYLYAKILNCYRKQQMTDLLRSVEWLAKAYPFSSHLDNAYYLTGLLYMKRGEGSESNRWFDRVLETNGNKVVSALYAKAQLARKQKNEKLAADLFARITQLYPGSLEAQQLDNPKHKEVLR